MSTNYEWQNQQVKERVQDALREADSHRTSRRGLRSGFSRTPALKIIVLLGSAYFLISILLGGCSPVESALAVDTHSRPAAQSEGAYSWSMADRIRFQDRLWEQALANGEIKPDKTTPWSLADRIRFQDRLESRP